MRRVGVIVAVLVAGLPSGAAAAPRLTLAKSEQVRADVTRNTYRYGPLVSTPGSNYIMVGPWVMGAIAPVDGYAIRAAGNVVRADGVAPPVEQLHMHHAVFLNMARQDATAPLLPGERFYGFAEEKTVARLPAPYGYFMRPSDPVGVNFMLHNGTTATETVWIELEVDFVPLDSALGATMRPARPLWMDVENGKAYPVFDVHRGAGGGRWEYPDDAPDAYEGRARLNEWVADRNGVLVSGAGHLHPGGLTVDLRMSRDGRRVDLFRSEAVYFDPNGPVSWDMAMRATPSGWRVGVRKGDVLSVHTTYETKRASWYESMGIFLVYMADDGGPDPFVQAPPLTGEVTHGPLPEAGNHGGELGNRADPAGRPDGRPVADGVGIEGFLYRPGDLSLDGDWGNPPLIEPGGTLRFGNFDAIGSILHTVTACRAPCTGRTGVSYPLADAEVQFDSGQLGYGPPGLTSAAQRPDWTVPKDLRPGTYTYFCRIHPFMRGAFRVAGTSPGADAPPPRSRASAAVRVAGRRLLARRGRVRVALRCSGREGACRGTVRLVRPGSRPVLLGRARYRLGAGRAGNVAVRLSARARRMLRRARSPLRVRIEAVPSRGATVSRAATLRAR